jgi:NitT/TauT family transport system substrate-binding protein
MTLRTSTRGAFCSALAAAAASPALGQTSPLVKIRLSGIVVEDIAPIYYAQSSGIFAKNGLDVAFDAAASGAAVVAAITAGAYDIGKASVISSFRAVARGIPVVAVAPGWIFDAANSSAELVVSADSSIRSGADLNGKTIAVGSLRELNQVAAMAWVDKHGGDSKTLQFIELPVASSGAAVARHRVDATVLLEPALTDAISLGTVRSIGSAFGAIASTFPVSLWIANSTWASSHPGQVRAFTKSLAEASQFINHHPDVAIALLSAKTGASVDSLQRIRRVMDGTSLTAEMLQPLLAAAQHYVDMPAISLNSFLLSS